MNAREAAKRACEEPTLLDALSHMAVWESERVVKQARGHLATGERNPDGSGWDTCFRGCFELVLDNYGRPGMADAEKRIKEIEAWIRGTLRDCEEVRDRRLRDGLSAKADDFLERRRVQSDVREYDLRISVYRGILANLFGDKEGA